MAIGGTNLFWCLKRLQDLCLSLLLLPVLLLVAFCLLVLNPFLNPGPLVFRQSRVGLGGACFTMLKFRTMRCEGGEARFATSEGHRIPPLGAWLRRYRLDELPQIINVLRGEMSLIGPRPEQPAFVETFDRVLPQYHARHVVRPGVSGLSQVLMGYASDLDTTRRKLALDLRYIRQSGFRMEAFVLWRTVVTVLTGRGAA